MDRFEIIADAKVLAMDNLNDLKSYLENSAAELQRLLTTSATISNKVEQVKMQEVLIEKIREKILKLSKVSKYSAELLVKEGRAAFYATIWHDLRLKAISLGWALGLHGTLQSDMDIMAMPWVENHSTSQELIEGLASLFDLKPGKENYTRSTSKPNNRVVYTIHIFSDFYLDINIIEHEVRSS